MQLDENRGRQWSLGPALMIRRTSAFFCSFLFYHSFMSFTKEEPHYNQSICLYLFLYKIVGLQVNSESNVRMEQGVVNHKQVRVRQLGLKLSYKV